MNFYSFETDFFKPKNLERPLLCLLCSIDPSAIPSTCCCIANALLLVVYPSILLFLDFALVEDESSKTSESVEGEEGNVLSARARNMERGDDMMDSDTVRNLELEAAGVDAVLELLPITWRRGRVGATCEASASMQNIDCAANWLLYIWRSSGVEGEL